MEISNVLIAFGPNAAVTWLDFFLLIFCPLGALLGTSVASAIERKQLYKDVPDRWYRIKQELLQEGESIDDSIRGKAHDEYMVYIRDQYHTLTMGNGIISSALGIVVALYFFGAITQDLTSIARVVGLCVLLGYQAPNMWRIQEKAVEQFASDKLMEITKSLTKK